jgi:hypothetical protein
MDDATGEQQGTEPPEAPPLLLDLGNAFDVTLGTGGNGREDKRNEYN